MGGNGRKGYPGRAVKVLLKELELFRTSVRTLWVPAVFPACPMLMPLGMVEMLRIVGLCVKLRISLGDLLELHELLRSWMGRRRASHG